MAEDRHLQRLEFQVDSYQKFLAGLENPTEEQLAEFSKRMAALDAYRDGRTGTGPAVKAEPGTENHGTRAANGEGAGSAGGESAGGAGAGSAGDGPRNARKMRVTVRPQSSSHQEVTFVVKASSKFSKIFEEYERKCNAASGVFRYHYDGARLRKDQTVGEIEPDDDEMVVDAFQEAAVGGRC